MLFPKDRDISARRRVIERGVSAELLALGRACGPVARQVREIAVVSAVERALEVLSLTVEQFGQIWLCGNGYGAALAEDTAYKLATPTSSEERPTRAAALGRNPALSTTNYGKSGTDGALAAELLVNGRYGDALWCFAEDPGHAALVNAAAAARDRLRAPVIVFARHPGTPLTALSAARVCIQINSRDDVYCLEWAHRTLAEIMARQIKRLAKKLRKKRPDQTRKPDDFG